MRTVRQFFLLFSDHHTNCLVRDDPVSINLRQLFVKFSSDITQHLFDLLPAQFSCWLDSSAPFLAGLRVFPPFLAMFDYTFLDFLANLTFPRYFEYRPIRSFFPQIFLTFVIFQVEAKSLVTTFVLKLPALRGLRLKKKFNVRTFWPKSLSRKMKLEGEIFIDCVTALTSLIENTQSDK